MQDSVVKQVPTKDPAECTALMAAVIPSSYDARMVSMQQACKATKIVRSCRAPTPRFGTFDKMVVVHIVDIQGKLA